MVCKCCWRTKDEGKVLGKNLSDTDNDPEKEKLLKRTSGESSFTVSTLGGGRQSHAYEDECDKHLEVAEENARNSKVTLVDPMDENIIDLTLARNEDGSHQEANHKLAHSPKVTFFDQGTPPISPTKPSRQRQREKQQSPGGHSNRSSSAPEQTRNSGYLSDHQVEQVQLGQKATVTSVEHLGGKSSKTSSSSGARSSVEAQIDDLNQVIMACDKVQIGRCFPVE